MRWSIFALILACTALMIGLAFAQGTDVPGDSNDDKIVSAEEVAAAEKLAQEGKLSADELQEIKHIHEKYPITITDSANRTVTIYKPVKRMIVAGTFTYEPIFILGAQDRLVAVTNTAQKKFFFISGMMDKPTVGEYNEIDYEKVIENKPDVYIGGSNKTIEDLEKKLGPGGTQIVILPFNEMNKFESSFKNLAKLLEEEDRADEFLNWRQGYINLIQKKTEKVDSKLRVYNEYSDKSWTTGAQTSGIDDIITLAGGYNIAGDLPTLYYAEVDPEWVVTENPAIIIIPDFAESLPAELTGYSVDSEKNAKDFIETVRNRTALKDTDAVKSSRIFVLDGHVGWTGSRGIIGVCYCAKWFYPEIFKDLDPEVIHKEYFEHWLGVPYKGIWAYPQESG